MEREGDGFHPLLLVRICMGVEVAGIGPRCRGLGSSPVTVAAVSSLARVSCCAVRESKVGGGVVCFVYVVQQHAVTLCKSVSPDVVLIPLLACAALFPSYVYV